MGEPATVVLAHGAWHGAWCWDKVVALLDGGERIMAARCTTSIDCPTAHSPLLSRPDLVAGLLAGLARLASEAVAGRG